MKTLEKVVKLSDHRVMVAGCMRCANQTFYLHMDAETALHGGVKALLVIECDKCGRKVEVDHDA